MKALQKARTEMVKRIAKSRLARLRRTNVPAAVDNDIRFGMEVLFYREFDRTLKLLENIQTCGIVRCPKKRSDGG